MKTFNEYLRSQIGNEGRIYLQNGVKMPTTVIDVLDDYIVLKGEEEGSKVAVPLGFIASWKPHN